MTRNNAPVTLEHNEPPSITYNCQWEVHSASVYTGMVTTKLMPAGLVLLVLFAPSHVAALSQDELLKSCEAVLSVANPQNAQSIEIPAAGLPCWYYMAAVQDMSTIVDQNGQPLLGVCAPSTTSLLDYVKTFVRKKKNNPANAGKNAAAQELTALLKAFPCH